MGLLNFVQQNASTSKSQCWYILQVCICTKGVFDSSPFHDYLIPYAIINNVRSKPFNTHNTTKEIKNYAFFEFHTQQEHSEHHIHQFKPLPMLLKNQTKSKTTPKSSTSPWHGKP